MRLRGSALALWIAITAAVGSAPAGTVTIAMPRQVDEVATDELGAVYLATGGHTLYGTAIYFDSDRYLWTTVNGVGVDPGLSGTGHEVALTGSAPFSAIAWATAATSVITGAGYSAARTDAEIAVTVANTTRATQAAAAQAALTSFSDRGTGQVVGALQLANGSSTAGNTTSWTQVHPDYMPAGAFRVIGMRVRRGNNVTSGIRMGFGVDGAGNADPEGVVVDHEEVMGNSGTMAWHTVWLDHEDVVTYPSGADRLWICVHGDGAGSSLVGAGSLNTGTYEDGSTNLWLTDGTSGSTTPFASPAGPVTSSFNFGVAVQLIIQAAPYQADGEYQIVSGAVPGRHDHTLTPGGAPINDIYVRWRIDAPAFADVSLRRAQIRLAVHSSGDANQQRVELWTTAGASTINGDVFVGLVGVTGDSQGTGWSDLGPASPIALTSGGTYGYSVKGTSSTALDVWTGGNGAGSLQLAGHPTGGPAGVAVSATEREVQGSVDETQIDFDPQAATATPNPSDGTVTSPGNLGMIALHIGCAPPTVTAA